MGLCTSLVAYVRVFRSGQYPFLKLFGTCLNTRIQHWALRDRVLKLSKVAQSGVILSDLLSSTPNSSLGKQNTQTLQLRIQFVQDTLYFSKDPPIKLLTQAAIIGNLYSPLVFNEQQKQQILDTSLILSQTSSSTLSTCNLSTERLWCSPEQCIALCFLLGIITFEINLRNLLLSQSPNFPTILNTPFISVIDLDCGCLISFCPVLKPIRNFLNQQNDWIGNKPRRYSTQPNPIAGLYRVTHHLQSLNTPSNPWQHNKQV